MAEIRILIMDNDKGFTDCLQEYMSGKADVVAVEKACDVDAALQLLHESQHNILIIEHTLLGSDGLSVMKQISSATLPDMPAIIILGSPQSEIVDYTAHGFDTNYILTKPVAPEEVYKVILKASNRKMIIGYYIEQIMHSVGSPDYLKGFRYLCDAINATISDKKTAVELYPIIAKKHDTMPSMVERAIRHVVELTWSGERVENIDGVFCFRIYETRTKPTNDQFINLVADRVKEELMDN